MIQELYFDMNVIINYIHSYSRHKNEDITKVINYLMSNNIVCPYSPAHIEEIAVIKRKAKTEELSNKYINRNLKIISKISNNYEYLPTTDNGIELRKEKPKDCFKRVIENYDNATILAESLEYNKVKKWKSMDLKLNYDEIKAKDIFKNEQILKLLKKELFIYNIPKYNEIKNNYFEIERLFEQVFDFLDCIGYKNDKKVYKDQKYRSRMHDISHGIYATKASVLITSDNNFKDKIIAIYTLLEVPTKVMLEKDFITWQTNKTLKKNE